MSALTLIVATALVLVAIPLLWRMRHGRYVPTAAATQASRDSRATAGRIARPPILVFQAGAGACETALARDQKRCIADKLEALPLHCCDARRCNCHFQQQPDQRRVVDRRLDADRRDGIRFEAGHDDRRVARDRRRTRLAWSSAARA